MRMIDVSKKYESKIYVIDKEKLITKISCSCKDFGFRQKKYVGIGLDKKYYAYPCKHLTHFVARLIKQGYTLKKPEEMIGEDTCPTWLRKELLEIANYMCQENECMEIEKLEPHRLIRNTHGGKYNKKNCVILCKGHHKARHADEPKGGLHERE